MTQPDPRENTRDEALRRIGRNVVNFQKIEMLLKLLVICGSAEGTVESFEWKQTKASESIRKKSLGQLTDALHKDIYAPALDLDYEPADPTKISMAFRLKLEVDAETANAQKAELKALVAERNRLIHHELGSVDFESDEACRGLIAKLDEQDVRIQKQMGQLRAIWEASLQMREELSAYMRTDEFAAMLKKDWDEE